MKNCIRNKERSNDFDFCDICPRTRSKSLLFSPRYVVYYINLILMIKIFLTHTANTQKQKINILYSLEFQKFFMEFLFIFTLDPS